MILSQKPASNAEQTTMKSSFTSTVIRQQNQLKGFIRKSVEQESDVEDLFQQLLEKVLNHKTPEAVDNHLSYAYKIAQNLVIDFQRQQQRHPEHLADEPACQKLGLEEQLAYQQRVNVYKQALSEMTELRRQVFISRRFHGLSRQQIASRFNLSEEAVKKHMSRAIDDLQAAVLNQLQTLNEY